MNLYNFVTRGAVTPKSVPPKTGPARPILADNFAKIGLPDYFCWKWRNYSAIYMVHMCENPGKTFTAGQRNILQLFYKQACHRESTIHSTTYLSLNKLLLYMK